MRCLSVSEKKNHWIWFLQIERHKKKMFCLLAWGVVFAVWLTDKLSAKIVENEIIIRDIDELLEMIQSLPSGCRSVFNLYVIEGYKHEEIAEQLGISENTSKSQLCRARNHLQKLLVEQDSMADIKINRDESTT